MKEFKEVYIAMKDHHGTDKESSDLIFEIESTCEKLAQEGWFYTENKSDSLLESLWLFFERDVNLDQ